jgi:PAS domain S-box-containing protein
MKIAMVGGGNSAIQLMHMMARHRFTTFDPAPRIIAVADPNPDAPGRRMAETLGLLSTSDYRDFFTRPEIDLIIELTGSMQVYNDILKHKPFAMHVISASTARLFWEVADSASRARRTDRKLQETRHLYEVLINELVQEEVVVIRADFRILDVNETLTRRLGVRREELIGQFCYKVTHHQDHPCGGDQHPCPLVDTLATGKPSQATHIHTDSAGRRSFVSISCYPLRENGRVYGAVEISRDITRDIDLQKAMMRQEKLASIGRLSAGVAHEINNPLTTILTRALLIQEDLPANHPAHPELDLIAREAMRCRNIVLSLLDFARQVEPHKKRESINTVARAAATLTQKEAELRQVSLVLDLHEEIPPLRIDPLQIQQAIIHLILNAVEASPPETAVTVRTRLSAEAGTVELTVADAGRGMSEEELDRIFDPFFTTKELGTGLGLAITHGIIEQHGGTISVNSRRGEGTAMTLRLPTPPQNEH